MDRRSAIRKTGLLAGAAVAMPTLISLLESCKSEAGLSWKPEFFTEEEAKTVSSLVDMILPRTETPGALDVNAHIFIDKVVARVYDEAGQQNMRKEISTFNSECKNSYGANFVDLKDSKRVEVLIAAEKTSGKYNPSVWGITLGEQKPVGFYRSIKSMALWAYFTSEEIGEKVLTYDPIPGNYIGCVPLDEVGNKYSL